MGRGTVQATMITILFTTTRGTKGDEIHDTQPAAAARCMERIGKRTKGMGKGILVIDPLGGFFLPPDE